MSEETISFEINCDESKDLLHQKADQQCADDRLPDHGGRCLDTHCRDFL